MTVVEASNEHYHDGSIDGDTPRLSATIARLLVNATPAHAWTAHPRLNPDYQPQDDAKFDLGSVVHEIILEGSNARVEVLAYDDWRKGEAKEARDLARQHGRIPLLAKQMEDVHRMVEAVRDQLERLNIQPGPFTDGQPEQTILWTEDGVACKARLDWLRDDHTVIDDLKTTTRLADPIAWSKTVVNLSYDVQAEFYRRAVKAAFGVDAAFRLIVAECQPPYAVSVLDLAPDVQELAARKVDRALNLWRECLAADYWPAWPNQVASVTLPAWAEVAWLDREEAMA